MLSFWLWGMFIYFIFLVGQMVFHADIWKKLYDGTKDIVSPKLILIFLGAVFVGLILRAIIWGWIGVLFDVYHYFFDYEKQQEKIQESLKELDNLIESFKE